MKIQRVLVYKQQRMFWQQLATIPHSRRTPELHLLLCDSPSKITHFKLKKFMCSFFFLLFFDFLNILKEYAKKHN